MNLNKLAAICLFASGLINWFMPDESNTKPKPPAKPEKDESDNELQPTPGPRGRSAGGNLHLPKAPGVVPVNPDPQPENKPEDPAESDQQ